METKGRKRIAELVENDFQDSLKDITGRNIQFPAFKHVNIIPYSESQILLYEITADKTGCSYSIRMEEGLPMIKYFIISAGTGDGIGGVFYNEKDSSEGIPEIIGFYCFKRQREITRNNLKKTGFNHYFYSSCFDAAEIFGLNSVLRFIIAGEKMGFLQTLWEQSDTDMFAWLYYGFFITLKKNNEKKGLKKRWIFLPRFLKKNKIYKIVIESDVKNRVPDSNGKSMRNYLGISQNIILKCLAPLEIDNHRWDAFLTIKHFQKLGVTPDDILYLMSNITAGDYFQTWLHALWSLLKLTENNIRKMIKFINSIDHDVPRALLTWYDYESMLDDLNLKLSLPDDFWEAHDKVMRMHNKQMHGDDVDFTDVSESLTKYSFSKNGYTIRPAANSEELYNESRNLHHCVSSYAKRMFLGQSYVFFLRKENKPDEPFYTIELSGDCKTLRQLKGKYNSIIPMNSDDPVRDTINSWCNEFNFTCTE